MLEDMWHREKDSLVRGAWKQMGKRVLFIILNRMVKIGLHEQRIEGEEMSHVDVWGKVCRGVGEESTRTGFETGGCLVLLKKCIKARVAGVEGANMRVEKDEVTKGVR